MPEIRKLLLALLVLLALTCNLALAQPHLSGALTGTLGPGTYIVDGNCTIANGVTVTIQPGTTFLHTGHFTWAINGTLVANGTAADSIRFTRQSLSVPRWGGLRFTPTIPQQNSLDYCVLEFAQNGTSISDPEVLGGGIYVMGNYLHVNHSRIYGSQVGHDGAGLYGYYATMMVVENTVIDSGTADMGGGIYLAMSSGAQIKNCIISRNRSTGT
jgi:hypothetical protein